jgi:hypothetical protein
MILLVPAGLNAQYEIGEMQKRNGFTTVEELESDPGCRRFRLS